MDSSQLSNGPAFDSDQVPYFYSSGKFLLYNTPYKAAISQHLSPAGSCDLSSNIVPKTHWPRQPTVEDIIQHGYLAIPESEPETALISDKKDISKLGLSDIISQIRQRQDIYENNMYEIELGKCYTISSQMAVESSRGGVAMSSKEAYGLNKNISEFYEQQRDERNRLWADISKLKLLLPEQAQSYLSSYRKLSILEDIKGDDL